MSLLAGFVLLALSLLQWADATAAEAHRYDCDAIRGTLYQSHAERDWYWQNCISVEFGGGVFNVPLPPAGKAPGDPSVVHGWVTHYGYQYEGLPLGCGYGPYRSADPTIAASAYDLSTGARPYQCGQQLEVCGDNACQVVVVKDACPGCGWNQLDLSESAKLIVCGQLHDNCGVSIRRLW